jgi:hypothetical protein
MHVRREGFTFVRRKRRQLHYSFVAAGTAGTLSPLPEIGIREWKRAAPGGPPNRSPTPPSTFFTIVNETSANIISIRTSLLTPSTREHCCLFHCDGGYRSVIYIWNARRWRLRPPLQRMRRRRRSWGARGPSGSAQNGRISPPRRRSARFFLFWSLADRCGIINAE